MRVGAEVGERDINECITRAEATSTERGGASQDNVIASMATSSVAGAAASGALFGQSPAVLGKKGDITGHVEVRSCV